MRQMRWCFLSFLGTSEYTPARYAMPDSTCIDTAYIQEAIVRTYAERFAEEGVDIRIMATDAAAAKHWVPDNTLRDALKQLVVNGTAETRAIEAFYDDAGMWALFNRLYDVIPEQSRLVLDITHGFRSLPMLASALLGYIRIHKGVEVSAILYGAFEATKEGVTPVVDLTGLNNVMRWGNAVDSFYRRGNARDILSLTESAVRNVLQSKTAPDAANIQKKLAKNLVLIENMLATSNGSDIYAAKPMVTALQQIEALENTDGYVTAFKPLYGLIVNRLQLFKPDSYANLLVAVNLCISYNMMQQGLTLLQEGLISILLDLYINEDPTKRENREGMSRVLQYIANPDEKYPNPLNDPKTSNVAVFAMDKDLARLLAVEFDKLREYRNNINHGGFGPNRFGADRYQQGLTKVFHSVLNIFAENAPKATGHQLAVVSEAMLAERGWESVVTK